MYSGLLNSSSVHVSHNVRELDEISVLRTLLSYLNNKSVNLYTWYVH